MTQDRRPGSEAARLLEGSVPAVSSRSIAQWAGALLRVQSSWSPELVAALGTSPSTLGDTATGGSVTDEEARGEIEGNANGIRSVGGQD